jgi:1,2-phenylacetyl-CoA epoxidase catalytic subunit
MTKHSLRAMQLTANVVVALADTKFFLAHQLAASGVGAPTLESAVACTAIAQEEAGHARGLYSLLEDLDSALARPPLDRGGDPRRTHAPSYLLDATGSFVRAIASLTLADRACTTLLEAATESTFEGLRRRAVRVLGDEPFHERYADGRVRELANSAALARELAALLPETLCWFGPVQEPGVTLLVETGVLAKGNEELRQSFVAKLGALAEMTGVGLPIAHRDGRWTYPELPWNQWNTLERRLVATPTTGL